MEYSDDRSQRSQRSADSLHSSRPRGGEPLSRQGSGSRRARHGRSGRPRQQRPLVSGPRGRGKQRGYELRNRSIGFASAGRGKRSGGPDARMVAALVLGIVAVVLLVFAISSCVSNNAAQEKQEEGKPRVATGISDSLSQELTARLDQDDQIAQIASNADQYPDERLVELALNEPDAISLVAGYLESDKTAQAYGEEASVGSYPQLFDWDSRWGTVDYAGSALAVTGSGPTVMAMATIGLTGSTDNTPATIAALAENDGLANGDSSLSGDFFTTESNSLGVVYHTYDTSADNISAVVTSGTVVAMEVKADSLTPYDHWILVVEKGSDGTFTVHDPTSSDVTSKTWDAETLASASTGTFYALTKMAS